MMPICPEDCRVCARPRCAAGECERTGGMALRECVECGSVFVPSRTVRTILGAVCRECAAATSAVAGAPGAILER